MTTQETPFRRACLQFVVLLSWALPALLAVGCSQQSETQSTSIPPPSSPASAHVIAARTADGASKTFGPLKAAMPAEWVEQTPSSGMRKAQFALPKAEGDGEDGELAVFYFGLGQGGSVEANIDRWIGQISQSDGSPSKDKAKTSKREISGMSVTLVDVSGTYSAGMMSNAPPRQGYRMLAAVVETPEGPWFFKLTGPEKTIGKWAASFDQFVNGLKK